MPKLDLIIKNAILPDGREHIDILCGDGYIIDIGKEGGKNGGYVVCNGNPEKIVKCKDSYTAKFLKDELN